MVNRTLLRSTIPNVRHLKDEKLKKMVSLDFRNAPLDFLQPAILVWLHISGPVDRHLTHHIVGLVAAVGCFLYSFGTTIQIFRNGWFNLESAKLALIALGVA